MICENLDDCVRDHAEMTKESVIDLAEGLDDLHLNSFTNNTDAVSFVDTLAQEAGDAFDLNTTDLRGAVNATAGKNASTVLLEGITDNLGGIYYEHSMDNTWAEWISTFTGGLWNHMEERKGRREDDDWDNDSDWDSDSDW